MPRRPGKLSKRKRWPGLFGYPVDRFKLIIQIGSGVAKSRAVTVRGLVLFTEVSALRGGDLVRCVTLPFDILQELQRDVVLHAGCRGKFVYRYLCRILIDTDVRVSHNSRIDALHKFTFTMKSRVYNGEILSY